MTDWGPGYSQSELDEAQRRFGLRFPPDLVELMRRTRLPRGYDWTRDDDKIREMLAWPLDGLLFDVENNAFWWPEWGTRPLIEEERAEIVRQAVANAPRLIPLVGHRFIPEEPHESGNPVFSVMQSDIIYHGSDLANYVANEFSVPPHCVLADGIRHIRFWSDMVDRNNDLGPR